MRPNIDILLWGRLRDYLEEDLGYGDVTSMALIPEDQKARGTLFYRERGVASGLAEAAAVFELLGCDVDLKAEEGRWVEPGEPLLVAVGRARSLLAGERLALNLVGHMAGIATQTRQVVDELANRGLSTRVAATRKTLPGLRELEKKAVVQGGGDPHRFRLDDCVLIKDNHLRLLPGVGEAVRLARERVSFTKKIEVEVGDVAGAVEAAEAGADIVMLDNMGPDEVRECLGVLESKGLRGRVLVEASGGIKPSNVVQYAEAGVDVVSMGSLTHSVRSLDVKLEIEMLPRG